jgi:hypothetical protein
MVIIIILSLLKQFQWRFLLFGPSNARTKNTASGVGVLAAVNSMRVPLRSDPCALA